MYQLVGAEALPTLIEFNSLMIAKLLKYVQKSVLADNITVIKPFEYTYYIFGKEN